MIPTDRPATSTADHLQQPRSHPQVTQIRSRPKAAPGSSVVVNT
ncbi:unnamed protein product [Diabrotica balteata]|uniref:Uncharacterized protein n=1 Tax=Diabrotica balteata TaxID=107213 RepID=A0A9N9XJ67_DIABA|nr:unnamed protein product [Diabrotica balteata]